jgi:hypothetical protein
MTEYRIDYSIQRREDGDDDFTEVGFGSTCAVSTVNGAVYEVESSVQNRMWETSPEMPDPSSLEDADA